jgi:hypothetical protein
LKSDFNLQNCPKINNLAEKENYKRITNLLRPMKSGAYPIRRRKASFMTLNQYRINAIYVDQVGNADTKYVSLNRSEFQHLNIIYAGTGKIS